MRILTRYVFREFLTPLFYCMAGFISIYVLFELFGSFSRIMESELPFLSIVLYFCGYLAPFFKYLAPAGLMLATLYTMWSFCRHSEIVAMRASGISFLVIARPLLAVAFAMALFVLYVSESFVPGYSQWAAQLRNEHFDATKISKADNIVFRNASAHRTWNVDELAAPDGSKLANVRVTLDREGGVRAETIVAEKAEYLDGEWWLSKAKTQHFDSLGQEIPSRTPELDALPLRVFPEFGEKPEDFLMQNRPWKYNSISDRFRYLETHPEIKAENRRDMVFDIWEQIMAPWACLIITLFAIPAGIASGRQSVFRGILGALGMFFAYYGVSMLFMILAKTGYCPPVIAAILPGGLFLVLGIRSFYRQR